MWVCLCYVLGQPVEKNLGIIAFLFHLLIIRGFDFPDLFKGRRKRMLYFELSNQARTEHQLVWIPRMLGVGGTLQGGLKSASLTCSYLFFIETCEEVVFQTEVLGALWKGKLFRPQILSAHRWYWNVTGGSQPHRSVTLWGPLVTQTPCEKLANWYELTPQQY